MVTWSHLERHPDGYVVTPGASSRSLRGPTWKVILIVTWSHLERHTDRYVVILIVTWSQLESRPDRCAVSPGVSS